MTIRSATIKTLLLLMCIYIKRVTATVSATSNIDNNTVVAQDEYLKPNIREGLYTNDDQTFLDPKEVTDELYCPIEDAVKINTTSIEYQDYDFRKRLEDEAKEIRRNITVRKWLRNGKTLHRVNGNLIVQQLNTDEKSLVFINPTIDDEGNYTCLLNYSRVTISQEYADKYFELYPKITFGVSVKQEYLTKPDIPPQITHPPISQKVMRGDNVTFECKHVATLTEEDVSWFRANCTVENLDTYQVCKSNFLQAVTQAKNNILDPIGDYYIEDAHEDYLTIYNVSFDDLDTYGCLVDNAQGVDIRLAELSLNQVVGMVDHPFYSNEVKPAEVLPTTNYIHERNGLNYIVIAGIFMGVILFVISCCLGLFWLTCYTHHGKEFVHKSPLFQSMKVEPSDYSKVDLIRNHLPGVDCPDIYNIGKSGDGFISGHFHQANGHLPAQSICRTMVRKEKNPSISSSNSHSDEASSWGKSASPSGDTSRAFYLHTSNNTATTVPLYDHPPSTGTTQQCGALFFDSCVINPTYGFIRPELDMSKSKWPFPRRNLERKNKIGEGQFGEVWRYVARQKDGSESHVAVKQLRELSGIGHREMLAEIDIMKSVNEHPNVIKLLNYCIDEYEPVLIIMEYAEKGTLQSYLRSCRSYTFVRDMHSLISKELLKYTYHIAKGMEYVASKSIVHRDLASRNILVSKDKICKVADFGFARRLGDNCVYERTHHEMPVPVKWMAPESLAYNKFTTKSDVYSMGILMWEIVTLGATPYEEIESGMVCKLVAAGGRLERPSHCKDEFYDIMARCWHQDPEQRPSFKQIADELDILLQSENDYIQLDKYPEHAYYNIRYEAEKEVVKTLPPTLTIEC